MQVATIDGSARSELSVSIAAAWSLKEMAAFVFSATMRAKVVASARILLRVTLKSYAIRAPLESSSAAPLMIMMIETIFFGIERLRNDGIIVPLARAVSRCRQAAAILNSHA